MWARVDRVEVAQTEEVQLELDVTLGVITNAMCSMPKSSTNNAFVIEPTNALFASRISG